jgi:hypothetical protein
MDHRIAREILTALVEGTDPETGEPLPTDSVLQRAGVLLALLAGATALRPSQERTVRRASLPLNVGKSWDDAEMDALLMMFKSGTALEEIAEVHGRTVRAIRLRLEHLGVLEPALPFLSASTPQQATSKSVDPAATREEWREAPCGRGATPRRALSIT